MNKPRLVYEIKSLIKHISWFHSSSRSPEILLDFFAILSSPACQWSWRTDQMFRKKETSSKEKNKRNSEQSRKSGILLYTFMKKTNSSNDLQSITAIPSLSLPPGPRSNQLLTISNYMAILHNFKKANSYNFLVYQLWVNHLMSLIRIFLTYSSPSSLSLDFIISLFSFVVKPF